MLDILSNAVFDQIASLINSALRYDDASARALNDLLETRIMFESDAPALVITVVILDGQLKLQHDACVEPCISINGSLVALLALATQAEGSLTLADSGVTVQGDVQKLKRLEHLIRRLDIDWEAALADVLGDVPAQMLGRTLRHAARTAADSRQRVTATAVEIVQEEWRLVPSKPEFEDFAHQIRQLASHSDRAEARLRQLEMLLKK